MGDKGWVRLLVWTAMTANGVHFGLGFVWLCVVGLERVVIGGTVCRVKGGV